MIVGNKILFTTKTSNGEVKVSSKCLNGRTNIMFIFLQFNSMEDVENAMELELLIVVADLFLAEIATGKEVFVQNVLEEASTTLMVGLAENAKEDAGIEEEVIEAQVAVQAMTGMEVDMEEEDLVTREVSEIKEVMETKEDLE
ncbi:MAG: hypothetical protein KDD45_07515, partial [Bdellovibrionales bacterium]|nr:hypothetical protein [Bdellovibrionales bacterium]